MAAGKTLQSIALLASLTLEQRIRRPHLVVVPLSVLGNWLREVAFWCPQLKAQKLHGNREVRAASDAAAACDPNQPHVGVCIACGMCK